MPKPNSNPIPENRRCKQCGTRWAQLRGLCSTCRRVVQTTTIEDWRDRLDPEHKYVNLTEMLERTDAAMEPFRRLD